jgi:hypothetical protein
MKPESSLESNEEPQWIPLRHLEVDCKIGNVGLLPSKAVLALIQSIEEGHFPVIFVNFATNVPFEESRKAYEAYIRCHISVIPVIYKEKEKPDVSDPIF